MHELVQAVIDKHKDKHKEVLEYLKSQGETQVSYSPEHVKLLVESGHLPKELGDWFFKNYQDGQKQHKEMQEFKKKNPDIPQDEFINRFFKLGPLSPEESAKLLEDSALSG